jgi:phosphatidylserine/phosphatidylglycerophosphate/cardiolipin synthase-like enzyme
MTSKNLENEVLVTGSKFLGVPGVKGTSSMMEKLMSEDLDELQILSYDITTHAKEFLNLLKNAIKSGVKTTMVYNVPSEEQMRQKSRSNAIDELKQMHLEFGNFIFVPFPVDGKILHAKVVIANRKKAYVGSSNFTWGGMSKNYEVGMVVGEHDSYILSKLVDSLLPRTV